MINTRFRFTIIIIALFLFVTTPCFATSENEKASDEDKWEFNLAPFYLWAINVEGDLSIGNAPGSVPLDVSFDEVLDSLEAAFIVHFEAMHKSNFGVLVDVNYLELGDDFTNKQGVDLKVDLDLTIAETAGLYRITRDAHSFDTILGVRGYKLNPGVSILNGPTVADNTQDWFDPFIGGRWIWDFAEDWSLVARGDIGGFGAGSDLAWQAVGLVEWQPFQYVSFLGGYRALDVNYEDGSGSDYFKLDATIHGPILGVNFKW